MADAMRLRRLLAASVGNRRHMPPRLAAACGLLTPLTYGAALLFGGLAQRDDFSSADDATSDLTGILIVVFALGLWRALSPNLLGRVGVVGLVGVGVTLFLEGFLRLDCQGIDAGCDNTSWYSDGHRFTTALSGIFIFGSPLVLAFAFRRLPSWRNAWLPTLAAIPAAYAKSWSKEDAFVAIVRGRLEGLGPVTAAQIADTLGAGVSDIVSVPCFSQ